MKSDTVSPFARVTVRRAVSGHAYPRNGNVHAATPRLRWEVYVADRLVDTCAKRSEANASASVFRAVDAMLQCWKRLRCG
jgi:hypothetical protein